MKTDYLSKKHSFLLYYEYQPHLNELADIQAGKLIKAVFEFAKNEVWPTNLDRETMMAFRFIADRLAFDRKQYLKKCKTNSSNAKLSHKTDTEQDTDTDSGNASKPNATERYRMDIPDKEIDEIYDEALKDKIK